MPQEAHNLIQVDASSTPATSMANNRLWAVCKADNEASCLSKSYGNWAGGFYCDDDFFSKHTECEGQLGGG